jgi:hypothetical protein
MFAVSKHFSIAAILFVVGSQAGSEDCENVEHL